MGTTESHMLDTQGMDCNVDSSKTLVVVMTTDSMDMHLSQLWEIVKNREAWHAVVHGVCRVRYDLATEQHHLFPESVFKRTG